MPGLYTHTVRNDGTTVSALIYNGDHQNHIDNLIPSLIDDYSTSVGQMQSTVDPGEVGTESLAVTLAGEVERLRFVIKEMRGTAQWYESLATRVVDVPMVFTTSATPEVWPDGSTTVRGWLWKVPHQAWVESDVTFTFYRRGSVSSGTAVMNLSITRIRKDAAPSTFVSSLTFNFTPGDTNTHTTDNVASAASFNAGDYLQITLTRLGADGGDTLAGNVLCDGLTATLTAFAGRP